MKRLFYLAVGAGVGVAAVRRAKRVARKLTPAGLADSAGGAVSGLRGSIRGFVDDVRIGMVEREAQLHDALSGDTPAPYKRDTDSVRETTHSSPHSGRSANGRSAS